MRPSLVHKSLHRIVLAGVPEQVNLPIIIAKQQGIFEQHGIDLHYRIVPEGTGKMLDLIDTQEVDLALCVTDAFIAGKSNGRSAELAGVYVDSPLCWAVAANPSNETLNSLHDLAAIATNRKLRIGISRLGSGSHSMAYYMSMLYKIDSNNLHFEILQNFDGLKGGVCNNLVDIFLWETFTTKPWFDKNELKKIGEVNTPWPAFSFVSKPSNSFSDIDIEVIKNRFYPALFQGIQLFQGKFGVDLICSEFKHIPTDAELWLSKTQYSHDSTMSISRSRFEAATSILKEISLVSESFNVEKLWNQNKITKVNE